MKTNVVLFALMLAATCAATAQSDTLEWTVLMSGKKAGFVKQLKNADGSFTQWYQFNDRGRGDSTVTRFKLNDQGFITTLDGSGVDYFKKPVFEKFTIENNVASWENPDEKGTLTATENVEYVPLKISIRTSTKRYFSNDQHTVSLLPNGTRNLTVLKELTTDGIALRLISLTGGDIKPRYQWIDSDDNFFASAGERFAVIRKGNEDRNKELLAAQVAIEQSYYKELASKLRTTYKTGLALTHATAFNSKTGTAKPNSTILINEGIIEIVSPNSAIPNSFRVIDLQNKFVMSGLWDMHVHYGDPTDGLLDLANGVTNVRDMANGESLLDRKREIDDGIVLGPRIQVMCGIIDGSGPYASTGNAAINTVDEGIAAIRQYKEKGYTQIKLYSSIKPEWVKPLAAEAHRLGMRVSGHIPAHMLASEAIDNGFDEIQHTNMLFLNFLSKDLDTRTPVRFHAVAQNAASLNLKSPEVKAFIKKLKKKKTVIDPTVSLFETMFVPHPNGPVPTMAAVIDRLPLELQRSYRSSRNLDVPAGQEANYLAAFPKMLEMIKLLYDNGIPIVPGTDNVAGFVLHKELENYVKAGIPNAAVLKMATLQSAIVAGKDKQFGSLAAGKVADIIVIDGNPLSNISDIRKVEMVIRGQEVYQCKDLLEALSIKYFE